MNIINARASWFVGGLIVGLAVGGAWGFARYLPALTPEAMGSAATTTTPTLPPESGDVSVSDQAAGMSVMVDSVTVPPPGVWVAVQELNEDGTLGNVLGAALVGHPASDVSVPLLRSTLPGQQYAVVLYRDDGDGQFSLADDSLYIDFTTGAEVEELFRTTSN